MNLVSSLQSCNSRARVDQIVGWVGRHPGRFAKLVELLLTGPERVQIKASWPLSYCVERHPDLAQPHLSLLIRHLQKQGVHDAVKRSIVRLLQVVEVPRRLQGAAVQACFGFVADPSEAPAIRVFSMTVADNLSKSNPDMRRELQLILEDQLPYASAGFVSRARKIMARNLRSGNR
jgi:hypothetical protein